MIRHVFEKWLITCFCVFAALFPAPTLALETILSVLVVHPDPTLGHTGLHLKRGGEQMYWDPGGGYGTELDDCVELRNPTNCEGYYGFPWDGIKRARKNDVFTGDMADLLRVITIYHLDGDAKNEVITFTLRGELAELAWTLIVDGRENGGEATFNTKRIAPYCTRAISEYLQTVGGPFKGIEKSWFPVGLGEQLQPLNPTKTIIYTMDNEFVQKTITMVRKDAGLGPLPVGFRMMKE